VELPSPLARRSLIHVAERARRAGAGARLSGRAARDDVQNTATMLWIAIACAPTLPLVILYTLLRRGFGLDVRAVRSPLPERPQDYVREGRTAAVARAELERLGLAR
jgi:hypothetical protein